MLWQTVMKVCGVLHLSLCMPHGHVLVLISTPKSRYTEFILFMFALLGPLHTNIHTDMLVCVSVIQATYSQAQATLTDSNFALGYAANDFTLHTSCVNHGEKFRGSLFHSVSRHTDLYSTGLAYCLPTRYTCFYWKQVCWTR